MAEAHIPKASPRADGEDVNGGKAKDDLCQICNVAGILKIREGKLFKIYKKLKFTVTSMEAITCSTGSLAWPGRLPHCSAEQPSSCALDVYF